MRIDGFFEVKRAGRRIAVPGKIRIRIAKPVRYSATEDPQHIAADLERRVKALATAKVASRYGEQCNLGSTSACPVGLF